MRQFWGQQQRFFKEMASASKVQFVVEQAKAALESGMSVVVGLQSTGESGMDKVRRKATSAFFSVLYFCAVASIQEIRGRATTLESGVEK